MTICWTTNFYQPDLFSLSCCNSMRHERETFKESLTLKRVFLESFQSSGSSERSHQSFAVNIRFSFILVAIQCQIGAGGGVCLSWKIILLRPFSLFYSKYFYHLYLQLTPQDKTFLIQYNYALISIKFMTFEFLRCMFALGAQFTWRQ